MLLHTAIQLPSMLKLSQGTITTCFKAWYKASCSSSMGVVGADDLGGLFQPSPCYQCHLLNRVPKHQSCLSKGEQQQTCPASSQAAFSSSFPEENIGNKASNPSRTLHTQSNTASSDCDQPQVAISTAGGCGWLDFTSHLTMFEGQPAYSTPRTIMLSTAFWMNWPFKWNKLF